MSVASRLNYKEICHITSSLYVVMWRISFFLYLYHFLELFLCLYDKMGLKNRN